MKRGGGKRSFTFSREGAKLRLPALPEAPLQREATDFKKISQKSDSPSFLSGTNYLSPPFKSSVWFRPFFFKEGGGKGSRPIRIRLCSAPTNQKVVSSGSLRLKD